METAKQEFDSNLKLIFLPFVATSHIIPMVDIARVLAMHGVDVTIIASPVAASLFQTSVDRDSSRGRSIRTHVVKFPAAEVVLPDGVEIFNADTAPDMIAKIAKGLQLLEKEIEKLFEELQADCIVTDMFYPWSADAAARLGIPRLIFLGGSYLAHSAYHSLKTYGPHKEIESDKFALPGLPHRLEMTSLQLPDWIREPNGYTYFMEMIRDSERRSYGSVFDSFYELEGEYQDHYKKAIGTNSWSLGPVSLWTNHDAADKVGRGKAKVEDRGKQEEEEEEEIECLKWLNSKPESSVLYVSFGSMSKFPSSQLVEIAQALEDSGHDFIWVVKKKDDDGDDGSFLEEFEKRVKASNKGYLIWGWAPQLLILENPAIGGIVTHCGWNTIMESVNAGLAMVTWPMFAEQFFNEKLLVDVLKIGVAVGVKEWKKWQEFGEEVVKKDQITKAIDVLMGNEEESVEMRRRARKLSDAAKRAIQVGGSSHTNVLHLIQELKSLKLDRANRN